MVHDISCSKKKKKKDFLPLPVCPNRMSEDAAAAEGLQDNSPKTIRGKPKSLASEASCPKNVRIFLKLK